MVVCALLGVVAGVFVAPAVHPGAVFAVLTGWVVFAVSFCAWTVGVVARFDEHATADHARQEDPSVRAAHLLVTIASVASLAGVGLLLAAGKHHGSGVAEALLGVAAVGASWFVVHIVYTLRYAREYYGDGAGAQGIDFEGGEPDYFDFAYVAFDLGMTYQISDTNLKNRRMRRLVLGHSLLSYALGVGVVATAINAAVSLAG